MDFNLFCDQLQERLKLPLPGEEAHHRFRAKPVGDVVPLFDHTRPPRPGGVIILLYEDHGVIRFPLIKRPDYPGVHGGQVSLPGGKAEAGEDAVRAALRECREEVGVPVDNMRVLGRLSDFYVMPSNVKVTPVIAAARERPVFHPDPFEVARLMEVPLDDVTGDHAIRETEILAGGKYRMIAPHFEIENEIVWGATAMMLNEFRVVLADFLHSNEHS